MASIGELTATVRADVSGFVGPMQQVVTTTQRTASQVQSIVAPAQQLGQQLGQTATAGKLFGVSLGSLRGSLASLASGLAGIPGPLGNIASKFAMFGAGGGVTIAVLAGIAAIVAGWRSLTEETRKQEAAVDDLKASYDEMFGATVRLRLEQARQAVADAQRGRLRAVGIGPALAAGQLPTLVRLQDTQELIRATQALQAAERAYAEHLRSVLAPGLKATADATRDAARAMDEMQRAAQAAADKVGPANTEKKVSALTKEAQAWAQVKREIVGVVDAERQRTELTKPKDSGDKEQARSQQEAAVQSARDTANTAAQAFMSAFSDNQENLTQRVTGVLRRAFMDAAQKLIAQKIFEGILSGLTGGASKLAGGGGGVGDVVGSIFGAPPPMAAGSGTIIVPLSGLPPALSPVEVARDVQHQTLWMETARVAEMNGFRLRIG